ncbi:DNA polymerase III, delta prime subunit [Calothrix sp. PCC 7716]|nr:DNA polymerase III, delta prime subunit [Calothrix sp. PCC 7716]
MNKFDDIVGQHTAKLILSNAIAQNQIAPAYLFTSTAEGVGKTRTAYLFASYLCDTTDMLSVYPQEENLSIGVEQVRDIITFLSTSPIKGARKVVIIHDCEITVNAANTLLKTLEEPGRGTLILITSQPSSILPTIKSRCQTVPFNLLSGDEVSQILSSQKINLHQNLLEICSGSPGRAIKLHNLLNTVPESMLDRLQAPPQDMITGLEVSSWVSKLDKKAQSLLLTYLQTNWWKLTKKTALLAKFATAREQFQHHVSPRNIWDALLIT